MGAAVGDYDNDGWPDLYIVSVTRNQLFRNNHDGTFSDVTDKAGVGGGVLDGKKMWSVSAAWVDYDNDGRLDLVVTALGDRPEIYRNRTEGGHWLLVELEGRQANRQGLGAVVCVETEDGRKLWNHATTSVGFASSSDPRVHFGLGQSRRLNSVEVIWPGGKRQKVEKVEVDRVVTITEPAS
jgi:hypothetical protein